MFSLVRSGPKMLLFESSEVEELKTFLEEEFSACQYDLGTTFETAGEDHTVVFITDKLKDIMSMTEIKNILVMLEEPDVLLCAIMSRNKAGLISRARIAPRILLLRAMGDMEKVLEEVQSDLGGTVGRLPDLLNTHNEKGSVIVIADQPLWKTMRMKDMYEKALFVEEKYHPLLRSLRMHALKYLNTGLGNRDWFEIEIRIYDRYSQYMLHYDRLLHIIEQLELGIILGESWSKDYPRFLMAVGVYRIRLFTFYDPRYIKRLLVGLEHLEDSTRIVDYDVYYNRKKMDWTDAADTGTKSRQELSKRYRQEILSKLSGEAKEKMFELENKIVETRT